jgi:hypothetical protein
MISKAYEHIAEYIVDYPQDVKISAGSGELLIPAYNRMTDGKVHMVVPASKIKELHAVLTRQLLDDS